MKHVLITGGSGASARQLSRPSAARGDDVTFLYIETTRLLKPSPAAPAPTPLVLRCRPTATPSPVWPRSCSRRRFSSTTAGICHTGLISQITPQQWQRLFDVNVTGIYHCVNTVLPGMLARQAGCIINVSSMWGQVGASCEAAYSATKGAVLALTKALAQELGPSHIRVNAVAPGRHSDGHVPGD